MNNLTLRRDDSPGLGRLGATPIPDWAGDVKVTDPTSPYYQPAVTAAPKKSFSDWTSDILKWGGEATSIIKTATAKDSSGAPVVITTGSQAPTAQPAGMSTTTKVVIGTLAAAAVGTVGYFALRKKKKGLGCTDPTPTLGKVKRSKKKK